MKTKVYVLLNEKGKIRYVGKTRLYLSTRLCGHFRDVNKGLQTHKARWIRSMFIKGWSPTIKLLEEIEGNGAKKEIAWIAYYRSRGIQLTNITDGGEGQLGCTWNKGRHLSLETRDKIRKALTGKHLSSETKEKISKRNKGKTRSVEFRQHLSKLNRGKEPWIKGKRHSEISKRKISEAGTGRNHSAATKQKISESKKGKSTGQIPWNKGRIGVYSKEALKKMSEWQKGKPKNRNPHDRQTLQRR